MQHDPIVLVVQRRPPGIREAQLEAESHRGVHEPRTVFAFGDPHRDGREISEQNIYSYDVY